MPLEKRRVCEYADTCPEPIYDTQTMFCILYSPNEEKDADLFQRNLLETRLRQGRRDFDGIAFVGAA